MHNFSGSDGGSPNALVQAGNGFIYGSAANGGDTTSCPPDGCGTLFRMDIIGSFAVLHIFHATDGYIPTGLVQAADGNFYGTTMAGGQPSGGGAGILFRMDAAGNMSVLYRFTGGFACCDGGGPSGPPIQASDGNFYGVTGAGGAFRDIDHQGGFGTVYRFNPATGVLTIIHSFNLADGNGIFPNGPLVQGPDGFFYGTTREGGGGVFKIDAAGNFALLHRITDSAQPLAGLIQASDGFFYGTTDGPPGTVFRVDLAGNYTVVNRFDGGDGYGLNQRLMQAGNGFFYGSAPQGGLLDFQAGDLFRLGANGSLSVLHSFTTTPGTGGYIPNAQLILGIDGLLYGTTGLGGTNLRGTIFRLDPSLPGPVASVSVQPAIVIPGNSATGTVTLTSPAPPGGAVVALRATSFQVVIPATVTVPAGQTTVTFTIQTFTTGANGDVRVYASVLGQGVRTIFTILSPTAATPTPTATPTPIHTPTATNTAAPTATPTATATNTATPTATQTALPTNTPAAGPPSLFHIYLPGISR